MKLRFKPELFVFLCPFFKTNFIHLVTEKLKLQQRIIHPALPPVAGAVILALLSAGVSLTEEVKERIRQGVQKHQISEKGRRRNIPFRLFSIIDLMIGYRTCSFRGAVELLTINSGSNITE